MLPVSTGDTARTNVEFFKKKFDKFLHQVPGELGYDGYVGQWATSSNSVVDQASTWQAALGLGCGSKKIWKPIKGISKMYSVGDYFLKIGTLWKMVLCEVKNIWKK